MKKFFTLALFISVSAFAGKNEVIYPQVYNYRSSAEIHVWNYSDRSVTCSGNIFLTMEDDTRQSAYYFRMVPGRFTEITPVYPRSSGDRIKDVSHTIMCF